ncbi:MAG TPA: hypothetical protein VF950_03945 [Planctomycetota bacterium]
MAIWFGAATTAEAQIDVTTTGPSRIYSNWTSMTVTATVSGYSTYNYRVKIKRNGTLVHDSFNQCATGSELTWTAPGTQLAMQLWPITEGSSIEISVKAWVGTVNDTSILTVTTEDPITYQPRERRGPTELGLRDEALAWLERKTVQVMG